jgi:ribosome-binding factor A
MANKRIARLNEQVRRELTFLLQRDVRDPRIGIVTVTDVEVSPDLYHAKVFYSVMGSDEDRASAAEGLRAAAGFLRTEIARRMHTRRAPELHFTYDDTLQHAMHIEKLLQEALATTGVDSEARADAEVRAGVEDGAGPEHGQDANAEAGTADGADVAGRSDAREEGHGRD